MHERKLGMMPDTMNVENNNRVQRSASCDAVETYLVPPSGDQLEHPGIEPQPQPPTTYGAGLKQPRHDADVDPTGKAAACVEDRQESEDEEEGGVDIMELADEFLCR